MGITSDSKSSTIKYWKPRSSLIRLSHRQARIKSQACISSAVCFGINCTISMMLSKISILRLLMRKMPPLCITWRVGVLMHAYRCWMKLWTTWAKHWNKMIICSKGSTSGDDVPSWSGTQTLLLRTFNGLSFLILRTHWFKCRQANFWWPQVHTTMQ